MSQTATVTKFVLRQRHPAADPLEAIFAEYLEAVRERTKAFALCERRRKRMMKDPDCPPTTPSRCLGEQRYYDPDHYRSALRWVTENMSSIDKKFPAAEEVTIARLSAAERLAEEFRVEVANFGATLRRLNKKYRRPEADRMFRRAHERHMKAKRAIEMTPANTVLGVYVKLYLTCERYGKYLRKEGYGDVVRRCNELAEILGQPKVPSSRRS